MTKTEQVLANVVIMLIGLTIINYYADYHYRDSQASINKGFIEMFDNQQKINEKFIEADNLLNQLNVLQQQKDKIIIDSIIEIYQVVKGMGGVFTGD